MIEYDDDGTTPLDYDERMTLGNLGVPVSHSKQTIINCNSLTEKYSVNLQRQDKKRRFVYRY